MKTIGTKRSPKCICAINYRQRLRIAQEIAWAIAALKVKVRGL
ncbi:hypothetical protein [Laspinema olomoucense]|nr:MULTISPECIES: hypothetical protein [unclassified Laspinema]